MKPKTKKLEIKRDERGWFAEIVRSEDVNNKTFGQFYITTALPGQTKGNHYHKRKSEWFCVVRGRGLLTLMDNDTGEKEELEIGPHNMLLVTIPPNYLHSIKNVGEEEMELVAYIDEPFDPSDPDTFYEEPQRSPNVGQQ